MAWAPIVATVGASLAAASPSEDNQDTKPAPLMTLDMVLYET